MHLWWVASPLQATDATNHTNRPEICMFLGCWRESTVPGNDTQGCSAQTGLEPGTFGAIALFTKQQCYLVFIRTHANIWHKPHLGFYLTWLCNDWFMYIWAIVIMILFANSNSGTIDRITFVLRWRNWYILRIKITSDVICDINHID